MPLAQSLYEQLDESSHQYGRQLLTVSYPERPRVVIVTQQYVSETLHMSLDLQDIRARVISGPGQATSSATILRFT
jgi:hypothetical protein